MSNVTLHVDNSLSKACLLSGFSGAVGVAVAFVTRGGLCLAEMQGQETPLGCVILWKAHLSIVCYKGRRGQSLGRTSARTPEVSDKQCPHGVPEGHGTARWSTLPHLPPAALGRPWPLTDGRPPSSFTPLLSTCFIPRCVYESHASVMPLSGPSGCCSCHEVWDEFPPYACLFWGHHSS